MPTFHPQLVRHDIGPVPFYQPPGAPSVAAPPPLDPLAAIAAALDALHYRVIAASRDDRMHPLGIRDINQMAGLLADLRRLGADHPTPLPTLSEPPATRALALPDLLPYLAPARDTCDQLIARQHSLSRLRELTSR